jgi:sodium/proline symporter
MGGFLAVSLTDMLQACFMILALVMLPVIAITNAGGLTVLYDQLQALDPTLMDPFALSIGVGIGFVGIGLGSPGNPHIIVRYLSIRNPDGLRHAALVGTAWNVIMSWGAVFIGLAGRAYFPETTMLPAADTENLYPFLAQQQLHPIIFGVVVASIFAAIMSTADSQLLVAASSVIRDVYERILRREVTLSQRQLVSYSRAATVVLVGIALALGFAMEGLVFWLVLFAWAGLGAALGPTSILALYWKRTTRAGILAGLVTGTITTIVWETSPVLSPLLYELIPAFALALLATVVVSLMTTQPEGTDEMMKVMDG